MMVRAQVLLLTVQSAVDLCHGLRWEKLTSHVTSNQCIPVSYIELNCCRVLCVCVNSYFLQCADWLELCTNLTSGFLQTKTPNK